MIKQVFTQIINRGRSNVWIGLELLVVFCMLWFIVDYFFVYTYNHSITSYRDTRNTFLVEMNELPDYHKQYIEEDNTPENRLSNFNRILSRIKQYPGVEDISISFYNTYPGSPNGHMGDHSNPQDSTKSALINRIFIDPEWDFFKVFRHTVGHGKEITSTRNYDWNHSRNLVLTQLAADKIFPGETARGKRIQGGDKSDLYNIVGVIDDIKRYDYLRPAAYAFFPTKLTADNISGAQISFRTKEEIPEKNFLTTFKKEMSGELRIGNFYLSNIQSFPEVYDKTIYKMGITHTMRTRTLLMFFLMFSIFLCILGIFWYRVNARKEEIGIRRALGGTAGNIRWLFIIEGIILLAFVVIPAMFVEFQFIFAGAIETLGQSDDTRGMYLPDKTILRFLITNLLTFILMAVIIVIAVLFPATIASRISPVDALRDE